MHIELYFVYISSLNSADQNKWIIPCSVTSSMVIGICADVAVSKYELWSSLAPLPFEVVVSAGQKAKDECWEKGMK